VIRLGLVGHPVAHSLSPVLQRACGAACGIDLCYDLFDVAPDALAAWLAGPAQHLDGFNVTAPHKQAVFARLTHVAPEARRLGAVNTVRRAGGIVWGHNTDLIGFTRFLGDAVPPTALVLGAGGAARAVVAALGAAGVRPVVLARHPQQARDLLASLQVDGTAAPWLEAGDHLRSAVLVVEATGAAAAVALPWHHLPPDARVLALAYGTAAHPLVAAVQAAGRRVEDGLAMLAWQGLAAFHHWTGCAIEPHVAFAALSEAARSV